MHVFSIVISIQYVIDRLRAYNMAVYYFMAPVKNVIRAKGDDIADTQLCCKGYQHLSSLEVWRKMENYFLTF